MRAQSQPRIEDVELASVLHALGDSVRIDLVRRMAADGECPCSPPDLDVPRSTLSNHWRILREAGLTDTRALGKARCMSLRRGELDARFPGVLAAVIACAEA
ncbi:transcriptional regulator [Phytomonospora sp. NPDC050363]|uniref:ArsR/SmtB family transcription factor n=1 Tax=Phytomonospora sp. NPDC050363 TaxID=3155642 RepID=UPI0033CCB13E